MHAQETGSAISTSLTALGKVAMALDPSANANHVPYRDSKLMWLLSNSLGGNSYTTLIATIHPVRKYMEWVPLGAAVHEPLPQRPEPAARELLERERREGQGRAQPAGGDHRPAQAAHTRGFSPASTTGIVPDDRSPSELEGSRFRLRRKKFFGSCCFFSSMSRQVGPPSGNSAHLGMMITFTLMNLT